jgi:hypothetical protein
MHFTFSIMANSTILACALYTNYCIIIYCTIAVLKQA